jgi:hypothetical protein
LKIVIRWSCHHVAFERYFTLNIVIWWSCHHVAFEDTWVSSQNVPRPKPPSSCVQINWTATKLYRE